MPFKERTASWWHRVADNKCQYTIYDEKRGMHDCGKPSRHVHHIVPEGTALAEGKDSEHEIGMPLCEYHHVRNTGEEEYSRDFSFHPDAGHAYRLYGEWKRQNAHMREITGIGSKKIPRQSPFEDMVDEHHRKQKLRERYHAGTSELDDYYTQKMRDKATIYLAKNSQDKKPNTAPNPRYDKSRKKNWYDGIF